MRSILKPVGYQKINDGLDSVGRATALSGIAMVGSLVGIGAKFGAGRVADLTSPATALVAVGVAALVVFGIAVAFGTGLRPDGEAVTVDGPVVRDAGSTANDD